MGGISYAAPSDLKVVVVPHRSMFVVMYTGLRLASRGTSFRSVTGIKDDFAVRSVFLLINIFHLDLFRDTQKEKKNM